MEFKVFDVVIRNKDSGTVIYAKIVRDTSATAAKRQVVKKYGIELSQSEYLITATQLIPYNRR